MRVDLPPLGVVQLYREQPKSKSDDDSSIDQMYDLLSHPERRAIVDVLAAEDPVSLDELATRIASETDDRAVTRARISLVHNHLPRFEAEGVLAFDRRTEQITFEPGVEKHQLVRLRSDLF